MDARYIKLTHPAGVTVVFISVQLNDADGHSPPVSDSGPLELLLEEIAPRSRPFPALNFEETPLTTRHINLVLAPEHRFEV